MSALARTAALARLNLQTLPARWGAAAVVVVCMAGVSAVMVAMLAMADGFRKTYASTGRADRAIVLASGETFEGASSIAREQAPLLLDAPGLARLPDGRPAAALERYAVAGARMRSGADGNLVVRGVGPEMLAVRPEIRIVEGRLFEPGLRELIVGRGARAQFLGLDPGSQATLADATWSIVGVFDAGGSAFESEAWGGVETVMAAFDLTQYSSLTARLASPASFASLRDFVAAQPRLKHAALRESDYYENQTGILGRGMRAIGYLVAAIMGIGALFAAVNTMYASIESRSVEIGTLRALGFQGLPIVASVLAESVLLCLAGAVLGGAAAAALFDGHIVSTANGASFTQLAFAFSVGPMLLAQGVVLACAIGVLGGLPPALRATRMPIVEALRAL